jgi:hypothetical protein
MENKNPKLLSQKEVYAALEQTRKNIISKYCCREHIVNPVDAKAVMEIEETQRLLRIEMSKNQFTS